MKTIALALAVATIGLPLASAGWVAAAILPSDVHDGVDRGSESFISPVMSRDLGHGRQHRT